MIFIATGEARGKIRYTQKILARIFVAQQTKIVTKYIW